MPFSRLEKQKFSNLPPVTIFLPYNDFPCYINKRQISNFFYKLNILKRIKDTFSWHFLRSFKEMLRNTALIFLSPYFS